ncbi:unnamed protein product [Enterobius vermicularis]|uniref:Prefoldin subunit 3 n=1 Tax=Enterobius vermicularis TaxID=51028 RepID=A0A0N4UYJ3_ENTVE|nr:unnamed protein product [Enterobius vermicularis]
MEENEVSKRGIPAAAVMDDVAVYLKKEGDITVEEGLKRLDELYLKYKTVEEQVLAQKARMSSKLPDLQQSLDILSLLEERVEQKDPLEVTHMLSEQVYSRVRVDDPKKVYLWLGANVMVEYRLDEARAILQKNFDQATAVVNEISKELDFVRDQITTTEVNIANVYNYGVQLKKAAAAAKAK